MLYFKTLKIGNIIFKIQEESSVIYIVVRLMKSKANLFNGSNIF